MSEREDQNKKTLIPFTRDHFNIQTNMVLTRFIQAMIPVTTDLSSQLNLMDYVKQLKKKLEKIQPLLQLLPNQSINKLLISRDFLKK